MRVLVLASRFEIAGSEPWLIDDLAHALLDQGAEVWVIVSSPTIPRPRGLTRPRPGLTVISVGTERLTRGRLSRISAMAMGGLRMRATVKRLSSHLAFDGVVFPSISLLYGRSSELLPPSTRRIHVMWDFFPTHHKQVGSLPSIPGIERPLKFLERWSMGRPDTVLSMSEVGRDFFEQYHPGVAKSFAIQAPWSSDVHDRVKFDQGGRFRVVFGGQLARGRGVDNLIRAAAHLLTVGEKGLAIDFLIAGSGPEEQALRDLVLSLRATNVTFTGQLSRSAYRDLLLSSHVGVAITDRRVDSPSFPSKIGDYARVGLPIIVATEASSDVGDFVESRGAGLAADPGSPESLADAILQLHEIHRIGDLACTSHNSRRLFEEHMSASVAATTVWRSTRPGSPAH